MRMVLVVEEVKGKDMLVVRCLLVVQPPLPPDPNWLVAAGWCPLLAATPAVHQQLVHAATHPDDPHFPPLDQDAGNRLTAQREP